MSRSKWRKLIALSVVLLAGAYAGAAVISRLSQAASAAPLPTPRVAAPNAAGDYIVLAWNDLGMHCYNRNFQDLAVLPPYNTLWAQVVRVGDPPQIVTAGISVTYVFTDNTYSVGKSNFWTYAQQLFGLPSPLPPNIGLTGRGLSGQMSLAGDHFVAEGIPLTEFRDSNPAIPYPFQLATVIARDAQTGVELARTITVAPVSTEMHCDTCHHDYGVENIATGRVETNILTLHDREHMNEYPAGHTGALMNRRPILCAECHSSNALGAPGVAGLHSLSNAMHDKHQEVVPSTLDGCYNCHPGPQTRCLRDTMSQKGLTCISCHGTMQTVSQNPNPWFNEPRCDNAACHGSGFQQDQPLYRMSKEHGGVRCEGCHDSTHAIAPSTQPNDAIKFIAWQGHAGTLNTCTVCHATQPTGPGPHGIPAPIQRSFTFGPNRSSASEPGTEVVYTHDLHNTGSLSDTYALAWHSTRGWANVNTGAGGPILTLMPSQKAPITVTVTVPDTDTVRGLIDTTVVTATSTISPTVFARVTDVTLVPDEWVYLPVILR